MGKNSSKKTTSSNKNISMKHKCEICEKIYSSKQYLKNHIITIHNQKGKNYYCNICTKAFKSQTYLTVHVSTIHGNRKQFKCESCFKTFTQA